MFDNALLPLQQRLLDAPARALARRGVPADAVTLAGFGAGLAAAVLIAFGYFGAGLAALLVNRLSDGLDGAVARVTHPTDRGAFSDIVLDFIFYALVPLAFALADPGANALPAAVLIAAFVATGSSFLGFAVVAAQRGVRSGKFPAKGIPYLGGLTEGAETIAAFVLMCLFPRWFPVIAYVFAGLCAVTAAARWRHGWVVFSDG
ncbi:MAG: CDP-alcohol phosphatidyltransferase family protein [Pseudomonadota bacterium]